MILIATISAKPLRFWSLPLSIGRKPSTIGRHWSGFTIMNFDRIQVLVREITLGFNAHIFIAGELNQFNTGGDVQRYIRNIIIGVRRSWNAMTSAKWNLKTISWYLQISFFLI
uniref:Putative ovule protein n=1 Tax=Solanum chacoense TaxID=4108 RepID=A0A0V0H021_SOLCH